MTYEEFAVLVESAGWRVAGPLEQDVALPCFTIEPTGIQMVEGFPVALDVCNVTARVPLGEGNFGNWDEAREMTYALMRICMGTDVGFQDEIFLDASTQTNPAQITYTTICSFPGEPLCPA